MAVSWLSVSLSLVLLAVFRPASAASSLEAEACAASAAYSPFSLGSGGSAASVRVPVLAALRRPGTDGFGCSHLVEDAWPSIKALEWAFDLLNKDSGTEAGLAINDSYIPGVKFVLSVHDTCGRRQVTDSLLDSIFPELVSTAASCSANQTLVPGVIGPATTDSAVSLAPLLNDFGIPLVSYSASGPGLSDRSAYPNFFRTIPSDTAQFDAIGAVLKQYNWTHIGILYTTDAYGTAGQSALVSLSASLGICVAQASAISVAPSAAEISSALGRLRDSGVRAVVAVVSLADFAPLFNDPASSAFQWIMSDSFGNPAALLSVRNARGLTSVSLGYRTNDAFETFYLNELSNVASSGNAAFQQWFMQTRNCTLSGGTNLANPGAPPCPAFNMATATAQYQQNRLVEPAIDAAFAYARALRSLWQTKCAGARGVCAALRGATYAELSAAVAATDFSYTAAERIARYSTASSEPDRRVKQLRLTDTGEPYETNYFVHNLRQNGTAFAYVRVGVRLAGTFSEWRSGSVNVYNSARDAVIPLPQFACPAAPCSGCLAAAPDFKFAHVPGQLYLLGVFSVHSPGSSPRSCGAVSLDGSSELDAFLYSVSQANSLVNATDLIGAVAIDDCGSSVLGQDLVDSLLSGARRIAGLDPSRIIGVVGSGSASSTDGIAQLLAAQRRSLISFRPAALTSSPYLYQTVASASAEAEALLSTLASLSVNYVQLVCSPDAANQEIARLFIAGARSRRICVSATYVIGVNGTHAQVMAQVKTRTSAAVVVALVTASDAAQLLPQVTAPVQLVGGVAWGSSQSALTATSVSQSQGVITVGEPRPASATPYQTWAGRTRELANETAANPWYSEWYESLNSCSLSAASMRGYTTLCSGAASHSLTASARYTESAYTSSVLRASASYALAASTRLSRVCTGGSGGVCTAFWFASPAGNGTGTGLQADLIAQLGDGRFTDPSTGSTFTFADRSVPTFGLAVYNVKNGSAAYEAVGATVPAFSLDTGLLQLAHGVATLSSSCGDTSRCSECAPYFTGTPNYLYLPGDILVGVLVNVRSPGSSGGACGPVKTGEGFGYTEAVRWTLDYINGGNKSDVRFGGSVKLGALILDVCGSSSVAISLVTSISQGTLLLPDRSTGANIDASKIRSWVSYGDAVTTALAPVLRDLGGVPLVSPSASSDGLTALGVFRTVPASLSQVSAIIAVINKFNWKCVQLVYSNNDYGNRLATEFRVQALREGICVPRCLEVGTDGSVASILSNIILDISKTRVVVVLSDKSADLVQLTADNNGLVFIASNYWGEMTRDSALSGLGPGANNSWVMQVNSPDVAGVTAHLSGLSADSSIDNPWLVPYYEALFNCSTTGSLAYSSRCNNSWPMAASPQFYPGLFMMTTTNALFSIAKAYADMLVAGCNSSYTSVCPNFWLNPGLNGQLADRLSAVKFLALGGSSFEFRSNRDGNMGWLALNRVGPDYLPVGRYMFSVLSDLPAFPSRSSVYSSVPAACADCTNCPKSLDRTEKFLYVPGQLLIGGLFDVHYSGSVPFSCGRVNGQNGFLLTEVFKYAIESIQTSPIFSGKLRGVKVGGIVMDTCSSAVRTDSLVANLHSGSIVLRDSSLNRIDPEKVMAYVAASTSEMADQLSRVTNVVQVPVISYAATMSSLSNKQLYPYFSRTVPSDDKVAYAIVDFLKRYGLTNVQFVLSPGAYGSSGLQSVQRAIANEGICISHTLQVNRTGLTAVNADQVASELLKRPQSTVIVTFLQSNDLAELLGAVSRNNLTYDRFLFIGTTYWGNSKTVLSKITNGRYPRAITFGFETADLTDFERSYLLSKNPTSYASVNPWFNEYYEHLFQCTLSSSSPYYSKRCSSSTMSLTDSRNYSQDSLALYVVNAVYSTALGIHTALLRICGPDYNGICSDFYGSGEKRQWVQSGIRSAVFVDATNLNFTVNAAGDSNRGYHIYELRTTSSGFFYSSVGAYNDTALLKLRSDFSLAWTSNCSLAGSCDTVCPNLGRN
uniref:G_PROTEIN_RECEP_F3_4 domain-containing protein n=1 Tax=Macrostomum lignano TaxID=282301 RepID=A0A1I8I0J7_9PLAT